MAGGHPTTSLAAALIAAADRYPSRLAVADECTELSYHDLDRAVGELTEKLQSNGIRVGTRVAVLLPRSLAGVIAIHAVVRLGATPAPLDPGDPDPRLAAACDGAEISHLLVGAADRDRMTPLFGPALELAPDIFLANRARHAVGVASGSPTTRPGYLLFTSGSTGLPRGVLLGHDAVSHFAGWAAGRLGLTPADRIAAQSALTFDLSTFDLFSTAMAGAAQLLVPDWLKPFPGDFVDWLAEKKISVIYAVPSLVRAISDTSADSARLPALRTIAYAGEPYPERALGELLATLDGVAVHNFYGPTETNVCTAELLAPNRRAGTPVSIGTAIDGVSVCVVDDELQATAGSGELVVAGPTLLDGYLAAGRLVDPCVGVRFPDGIRRRAYRTGDRAATGPDGRFYLSGRRDAQIKRNGFRIDLAGLEATAASVAAVRHCAAIAVPPANRVLLYLEPEPTATRSADELIASVHAAVGSIHSTRHRPDRVEVVAELPRNVRGKIDYAQLRSRAAASGET
ncbi:AMP-binding protein [Skermania piniformis]|uniref:AMP-binding protein n=1 Tax=Skermania pinensis TaxID=39122 RepID=A0ABX8SCB8_9ACTN|nr:AMP-binding protein [Skermania piniformis]QXQ13336.1 AMP-binding protein [Skermania piniformis]